MILNSTKCLQCGNPLSDHTVGGNCPHCLLAQGLGAKSSAGGFSIPDLQPLFPNLEILELVGHGGMGVVYKARQTHLGRIVALKILQPVRGDEIGFAERFTREARTLARLSHPHIVSLHEFGESEGLYYLILEYVDGPNLRQVIRSSGLPPSQALSIVPEICAALQYAHDQGVIHRDVKPENVLLDRAGHVHITDFGLAKLTKSSPEPNTLTRDGQVLGTWHYMAPEQYHAANAVDHRADIYSLGVVFYELLTGQVPMGSFPPPSTKVHVDVRLDDVVTRALAQDKERRFQAARDVADRVHKIANAPRIRSKNPTVPDRLESEEKPRTSRLAIASLVSLPIAILSTMAWGAVIHHTDINIEEGTVFTAFRSMVAVGAVVGLVALIRIALSQGRRRGLGWATTATLGSFLLGTLASDELNSPSQSHLSISPIDRLGQDDGVEQGLDLQNGQPQNSQPQNPFQQAIAELQPFLQSFGARVKQRDSTALTSDNPEFDDILNFYSENDRSRVERLGSDEMEDMAQTHELGLPLFDLSSLPYAFEEYFVETVSSGEEMKRVEVKLRCGDSTVQILMSHLNQRWGFLISPVVVETSPVEVETDS